MLGAAVVPVENEVTMGMLLALSAFHAPCSPPRASQARIKP